MSEQNPLVASPTNHSSSEKCASNAQVTPDNIKLRKIRSFVRREGRMSDRQKSALTEHWPEMGLEVKKGKIDPVQQFSETGILTLEIGFGMGRSLVEQARVNPENRYIGIEVHTPGVGACMADAAEQNIKNLRIYEHDAVEVLNECIPDQSVDVLQLFFPDPWHKTKHHKRRIVQPEFVQVIRRKLKVGGLFHMATDWQDYAVHMLKVMQQAEGYDNTSKSDDYVDRPQWRPLTKFEQRGHRLGNGVWDLIFKRNH